MNPSAPETSQETPYFLHRRFDRMARLAGEPGMERLHASHVMVIGLGGVGSWAVESLARSGVGRLSLVDFDEACITNTNRQLHALKGSIGKKKAVLLAERVAAIHPQVKVESICQFFSADTAADILSRAPDVILDAIDNLTAKSYLLAECKRLGIPVITSSGASARWDPTRVKVVDLAQTHTDPMAHQLRKILRQKYDFAAGEFGIPCVFSDEEPLQPEPITYDQGKGFQCVCPQGEFNPHSCDRRSVIYGNASFVTGAFGLAMASWAVRQILGRSTSSRQSPGPVAPRSTEVL